MLSFCGWIKNELVTVRGIAPRRIAFFLFVQFLSVYGLHFLLDPAHIIASCSYRRIRVCRAFSSFTSLSLSVSFNVPRFTISTGAVRSTPPGLTHLINCFYDLWTLCWEQAEHTLSQRLTLMWFKTVSEFPVFQLPTLPSVTASSRTFRTSMSMNLVLIYTFRHKATTLVNNLYRF